jgi:hypothetical protein
MGLSQLSYGECLSATVRIVTLRWDAIRLGDDPEKDAFEKVPRKAGVYAIEGWRDGTSGPEILYIGRTGQGTSAGVLPKRTQQSLRRVLWKNKAGAWRLYSDVSDVLLRWAPIDDLALVAATERVLIAGHRPSSNAQSVKGPVPRELRDVLVLNAGKKGRLLPCVFGGYYLPDLFADY